MRLFIYTILFAFLSGCAGSPIATESKESDNTFAPVVQEPSKEELLGTWQAEDVCYDLLEEKGYLSNIMRLLIKDETAFSYESLPDLVWAPNRLPMDTTLRSGYGNWMFHNNGNQWLVTLDSDTEQEVNFLMYRDNNELVLYIPVGETEESEGIIFRRSTSKGYTGSAY